MNGNVLYELQLGKTLDRREDIKRISIRMTEREKSLYEFWEKVIFGALKMVARVLLMIIAVLEIWFLISFFIIVAG